MRIFWTLYKPYWRKKFGAFQLDTQVKGSKVHWPKETVDAYVKHMKQKLDR